MKKTLSFVALAAVATVLISLPGTANAQVAFGFRGPHGSFAVGVGPFVPQVGAYVPDPYAQEVYLDPDNGYGFYYDSEWVPCRQYGSGWIIAGSPIVVYGGVRDYGYRSYGYARPDYRSGYVRPYAGRGLVRQDSGRSYSYGPTDGRRDGGGRSDSRRDGRSGGRSGRPDGRR